MAEIVDLLTEARARTLLLVSTVSDEDLLVQHDPLMSPIIWDLGHIGHFEDVWLVESVDGGSDGSEGLRGMYDPVENPRSVRAALELPGLGECEESLDRIRSNVADLLPSLDLEGDDPLLRNGFVFRMVLQHEYQHNETILQTLQLKRGDPYCPRERWPIPDAPTAHPFDTMVLFPGGRVDIGSDDRSTTYDNERPRHDVDLAPFLIDAAPVTEGQYSDFVAVGGYQLRDHWSDQGWAWLQETGVEAPEHWGGMAKDGRCGPWIESELSTRGGLSAMCAFMKPRRMRGLQARGSLPSSSGRRRLLGIPRPGPSVLIPGVMTLLLARSRTSTPSPSKRLRSGVIHATCHPSGVTA